MTTLDARAMGTAHVRIDAREKVTGAARYAYEQPVTDPLYLHPIQASIGRGRVGLFDATAAEEHEGVAAVLSHVNAPRLASTDDEELAILQSPEIAFRGQLIGVVVADTPELARYAAGLVHVAYEEEPCDVVLRADRDDLYEPESVNPAMPTDTTEGDPDAALAAADVAIDATYTTPMEHNNPMEPHATVARWDEDGGLTLYESTQGVYSVRNGVAPVLGIEPDRIRVISPYVGGGFGSKGTAHAHIVLAALAAWAVPGRPVKLALTRQQMFSLAGYRTPTIQRMRLGLDADGNLTAMAHDVVEQTSRVKEFAEQSATPTRNMYAGPNRRTSHRLAALDVPVPSWMRAPGVCPGMYALEAAMDELAVAAGIDPVELRIRNDTDVDPESGKPYSTRGLAECLREGARRFGWDRRDPTPGARREGGWYVGLGVASSTYPTHVIPGSVARIEYRDGGYEVRIGAADIGTGARTVLAQIAADALGLPIEAVHVDIGDTAYPRASVAGGSSGTNGWGSAIVETARRFRDQYGDSPVDGAAAEASAADNPDAERFAMQAFGAQFAEVRVDADTGEVRVPRLLGVFAAGRIVNPRTARSQFVGGMTMGLSMALHEDSVMDERYGHVVNHDFAEYHIAANADVGSIEAHWLDEHDPHVNPMGVKGIGEIGIVGTAAAITSAVYNATGVRVRDLPVTADKLLDVTGVHLRR
ncbi:MAG: xanthine dehydrogenase family protein molybdopterin-binding subunit [Streptosporangiales bacterium]|nr:xanthine dehydrogenase family protein molybdopterin-binding subunit [Streptosporangiales bacterium]